MVSISFTQHRKDYEKMNYELEKHLREMGVIPASMLDELAGSTTNVPHTLAQDRFYDPRDENGEVLY
tara:strand:+ start:432 stop:632 length:201 start_codon:yes stop_codon:yes gene_type:complete